MKHLNSFVSIITGFSVQKIKFSIEDFFIFCTIIVKVFLISVVILMYVLRELGYILIFQVKQKVKRNGAEFALIVERKKGKEKIKMA